MIVIPYTRRHPATARLANRHAPGYVRVKLDPDDMGAYWALLAHLWREPGELVVIEHDIGIGPETLPGFAACPEPWCGNPYRVARQLLVCLGCTRFSAALKAAEPDLLEEVGDVGNDGLPAKDWRRLDVRILDALRKRGYRQHWHEPMVKHFHDYGNS